MEKFEKCVNVMTLLGADIEEEICKKIDKEKGEAIGMIIGGFVGGFIGVAVCNKMDELIEKKDFK